MPVLLLLTALACPPPQEGPLNRAHIEKLVVQLDGENAADAEKAAKEISRLPTSSIPLILEIAAPDRHPRAAERLRSLLPPEAWRRIFRRPIGAAVHEVQAILTGSRDRDQCIKEGIRGLACLPPVEANAVLERLSKDPDPAAQDFASVARLYLDPTKGESFASQLSSPVTCERAADLVILAGDVSAIPKAVEVFCRQEEPESRAAARVLEVLGAGPHAERIAAVLAGGGPYSAEAARILDRTGGDHRPNQRPDVKSTRAALAALRRDKSPHAAIQLRGFRGSACPELAPDVKQWLDDPSVTSDQVKCLLPLWGAVGGKDAVPLLLEKLKDPRVMDGAAEGLAMIGDPAHAPAVWRAFISGRGMFLNSSMISFPPETIEDELVAEFAKKGFPSPRAVQLAWMKPSPRIRKAVFERLVIADREFHSMWDLPLLLGEGRDAQEKEWIEKMREPGHARNQYGHFLALRGGNGDAAETLARMWAEYDDWGTLRNPANAWNWKACEAAGPIWKSAVEKAWRKKPGWAEGLIELSRWGVKDAVEELRKRLESPDFQFRDDGLRALARQGDPAAVEWFLERLLRISSFMEADEELLTFLIDDDTFRRRVRVIARCQPTNRRNWAQEFLAKRADPEDLSLVKLGAVCGSSACLRALVRLKDPESLALTFRHLRSPQVDDRIEAIRLLEQIASPAAVPSLLECLDDMQEPTDSRRARPGHRLTHEAPPLKVAVAAMDTLEKLTGEKSPAGSIAERREYWRNWRANHRPDGK